MRYKYLVRVTFKNGVVHPIHMWSYDAANACYIWHASDLRVAKGQFDHMPVKVELIRLTDAKVLFEEKL